ncbi:MAG: topoisomerase DNA-binding C4 zinc finger domain-containing protein, partial [Rhodospirillales bacterium]|nr:topoisomerase DNA-binding C4 zinc finger domain-containing protein [Rhodospirillales bacterium]
GKYGAFIGCSNYPECRYTRQLAVSGDGNGEGALNGTKELGTDPETGLMVTVRSGRFGPYIQLGEATDDGEKPKRASIPKGWDAASLDLERALALLSLPRLVGLHPETGKEITADAIMASACLPHLFHAVEIGKEAYWDGGYSGNPALFPFFTETESGDILLVQVNPIRRDEVPTTSQAIIERVSEITFNASLLREFRAIDFVNRLIAEGRLDKTHYRANRLHRIDATAAMADHTASSKLDTSWSFFEELHASGRAAARRWLSRHYADVGVKQTLDLRAEFM